MEIGKKPFIDFSKTNVQNKIFKKKPEPATTMAIGEEGGGKITEETKAKEDRLFESGIIKSLDREGDSEISEPVTTKALGEEGGDNYEKPITPNAPDTEGSFENKTFIDFLKMTKRR